ncbi:hypothetical protein ACFRMQ_07595 [Kitasatospora sp. NPDC056783]|uniref:hypothetical protein n=1 Tax=Kitasatospora sp. NPDC056783 TaxID=3345943 RepID=UPI0036816124
MIATSHIHVQPVYLATSVTTPMPHHGWMQLTTPTAAGLPEDRRSAAGLRFAHPVRLRPAATTTGPAPGTTGPSRNRR